MSMPEVPQPVIDPGLLIEALKAHGWVKAGGAEGVHVVMVPNGGVVIPVDKANPMYVRQMEAALRRLEHEFGLRPSLLEGVVTAPDDGVLP